MLRTGFIGCGGIVERRHAPGFKARSDRAPVVAIADLSEERLRVVGEMLGVAPDHRYTDAQRMLEREELDLVDITSPHGLHAEHVIAAAQAGCHVLIEKPIARTPDEARQAIRETHERGVKLRRILRAEQRNEPGLHFARNRRLGEHGDLRRVIAPRDRGHSVVRGARGRRRGSRRAAAAT